MNNFKKIFVLICIFIIFIFFGYNIFKDKTEYIDYNDFLTKIENQEIEEVLLTNSEKISLKLKDSLNIYTTDNPRIENFKEMLLKQGIYVKEVSSTSTKISNLLGIIFILIIIFVALKQYKKKDKSSIHNFKQNLEDKVYFKDIAGNEEAKANSKDIVEFLKNPEKYKKMHARMPKGIIFYGEPGTGKTLMAKAIATEANVPFYSVCGSDFVEMYVGVGAARVRSLFKTAREHKKAVIFIDEIDAIGKKRANTNNGATDEKDQTLNALLSEMSFNTEDSQILVIAATNRFELLDKALLRAGRFDRHIEITLPDKTARAKILKLYLKNKNIEKSINIDELAKKTTYFSGAMLENLINEATIFAIKDNQDKINKNHIDKAYLKIIAGDEKIDKTAITKEDKKITAFHEAGHAIITKILEPTSVISKISIIPTTKGALGFCLNIFKDKIFYSKKDLENQVMIAYAGRAAEEIIFGKDNITTGAFNDIKKATNIIKDYVAKYGFCFENGLLDYENIENDFLKEKYKQMSINLYEKTKKILKDNKPYLIKLANTLLEKESIDEYELNIILA